MTMIENRPFSELKVGDSASIVRTLREKDITLFAMVSGDVNPAHLDADYAKNTIFNGVIAHGMWSGALISAVLGTQLPGPGTIYLGQSLRFLRPVTLGDTVTVTVNVAELQPEKQRVKLDCRVTNQKEELVVTGQAEVIAPKEKLAVPRIELPEVELRDNPSHRLLS